MVDKGFKYQINYKITYKDKTSLAYSKNLINFPNPVHVGDEIDLGSEKEAQITSVIHSPSKSYSWIIIEKKAKNIKDLETRLEAVERYFKKDLKP